MEQRELKKVLAGVSLAALLAASVAAGCAHAGKSSCTGATGGGGEKSGAPPAQGGGMSGCGGASGCGGKKQ